MGLLTGLRILKLDGTSLFGSIPSELGQLTKLEALHLGSDGLNSTLPSEIVQLTTLREFLVQNCAVSGKPTLSTSASL